jgi:hypothetical protein
MTVETKNKNLKTLKSLYRKIVDLEDILEDRDDLEEIFKEGRF